MSSESRLETCPKCGHLKYINRPCYACIVYAKRTGHNPKETP